MKNQQMIEILLPNAPGEALADRIGSWSAIGGLEQLDATGRRHSSKARPEFAVVITNELFRRLPIGGGFSQVLGHPGIGWRACHADRDDLPRLQEGDEEGKERSKEQIAHLQEITGPDLFGMGAQKRAPLLTSCSLWPSL
jgi:hypothetical protein